MTAPSFCVRDGVRYGGGRWEGGLGTVGYGVEPRPRGREMSGFISHDLCCIFMAAGQVMTFLPRGVLYGAAVVGFGSRTSRGMVVL